MHTGCLILEGKGDLSEMWRYMIEDVPAGLTIGSARRPEDTMFLEVTPDTPITEVLHTIHRKLSSAPYSYIVWADEAPRLTLIPNRSSTVALWMDGGVISSTQKNDPVKLLTRLNQSSDKEKSNGQAMNYTQMVRDRVIKKIPASKWAMTMLYAYISKPSFILSTKRMQMYLWLVIINHTYVLVWSTQENIVKNMIERLEPIRQHQVFVFPIEFEPNSLLTIHPLYLISKLTSTMGKYTDPINKRMMSATYIKNYITRMKVSVDFQSEVVE